MGVTRASLSRLRLPIPPLRLGFKYSQNRKYVKRRRGRYWTKGYDYDSNDRDVG